MSKLGNYVQEAYDELLHKVSWPSWDELQQTTIIVLAARREVRNVVREALRPMGLMVDFVQSIGECREFCQGGLPHAIVHESALGGEKFESLRAELLKEMPALVFIELSEQGHGYQVREVGGRHFASVNRDALVEALPAALMFELSRAR